MYLAYFDESGDPGHFNSPTRYFVLAGVLVHETAWLSNLDSLIALRRRLRDRWGISTRPEIKAHDFSAGHGAFHGLGIGLHDRMNIFRDVMRFQASQLDLRTFAVAIDKTSLRPQDDARERAWTNAVERVDRFCAAEKGLAIILPDEGHGRFIQRLMRRNRRFHEISGHYGGRLSRPTRLIVEDPIDKKSHDSYLTQLADWNAAAAMRSRHVDPRRRVPLDLWDELGPRLLREVNAVRGGPPGIVRR